VPTARASRRGALEITAADTIADGLRLRPDLAGKHSPAQQRTLAAALELFADHGVSGTSLQMIADLVGVTKAAIYHQFKTKDAIVIAVAELGLAPLEAALQEAEAVVAAEADPDLGRALLWGRVVDVAVARRRWVNALQGDPVMIRLLGEHEPFVDLMNRVYGMLLGEGPDAGSLVRTAILSAAVGAALVHPLVAHLDDETLRAELMAVTDRLFGMHTSPIER
jgi:AcrR family transcriptional regulator